MESRNRTQEQPRRWHENGTECWIPEDCVEDWWNEEQGEEQEES